ncbi:MAG TPA: hypothetical protein VJH23_05040 [archaeon]|nr:hypothetical protein [archaeon]
MNEGLLQRLQSLSEAFSGSYAQNLKRLGNDFIEEAAETNDTSLARLSVISYALYKILSKDHFVKNKGWGAISRNISAELLKAARALEKNDIGAFARSIDNAVKSIEGIDDELSNYAKNIYEKARIKQASTAYAAGLSLNQAAALTGADSKEVQKYIGFTRIHDEQPVHMGIEARMKMLRGLLGK